MPKRKRLGDDGSEDGKRRRKMDISEILQELHDAMKNQKSEDGRLICENFIRAPSKRSAPEYYEVVPNPIDLLRIQQKIKMDEYNDIDAMTVDVEQLVNNAKSYHKEDTQEFKDAVELWDFYVQSKNDFFLDDADEQDDAYANDGKADDVISNAGSEASVDDDPCEELFTAVMTANEEDRSISDIFRLLPSKSMYPDYFDVIKEPIDLKTIGARIQAGHYVGINDLEKDLLLMIKNAKHYNEPGSQVYRDALTLRKLIISKKSDIDQRKINPIKTSDRIKAKKSTAANQKWSQYAAALKYEDGEEEPAPPVAPPPSVLDDTYVEEESDPEDAESNPHWTLFETVRNHGMNHKGVAMSAPFVRLPNRRAYPDYYQEIKRPISLCKIKTKIKAGYYVAGVDLVDDFSLMFENAKKYNRPDSKIYKDACTLQKLMLDKAKELNLDSQEESVESEDNEDSRMSFSSVKTAEKPVIENIPSVEIDEQITNDAPISLPPTEIISTPTAITTTPVISSTTKKKINKRLVTGYIIFASEVRKSVVQANPECNFGDISRIIGAEWKNLVSETKAEYERKAQKQNEESAKEAAKEAENYAAAPPEGVTVENGILECRWEKCDFQFEESSDLMEHLVSENGHVWRTYGEHKDKEELIFQCLFHGCGRVKKGAPPFPNITRLVRHCKEVHVTKQQYKPLAPNNRTKNYISSKTRPRPPPVMATTPVSSMVNTVSHGAVSEVESVPIQTASIGIQVEPTEPIFVAPPRPSRLVHSSTYIEYIKRLQPETPHLSNWETELNATPENTRLQDHSKLPTQWLANGPGNHGNVVNALWALRQFMFQDCLTLYKK
ncbi:Protein polybromo-1 [Halotydeus destructor]|nr:Protein polybromo-1 [Halotydeus destructor]